MVSAKLDVRFRITHMNIIARQNIILVAERPQFGARAHGVPLLVFAVVEKLCGILLGGFLGRLLRRQTYPSGHITRFKLCRTRSVAVQSRAHILCRVGVGRTLLNLQRETALPHIFPTGEIHEGTFRFYRLAVVGVYLSHY